ncbi:MAG TPA: PEP-CTERM sorting domain-containing protein [Chthoniobacteraceae bacterium]|jgi:hypothetical protein|nr:PEP-CTERM sorting domain-containing protein [Chthoniobacteraceae bacterium]
MRTTTLVLVSLLSGASALFAAPISLLNYSFESPTAPDPHDSFPVSVVIDNWQRNDVAPNYQLGAFQNPAVGDPLGHINNLDGNQGGFIVATPGIALWQTAAGTGSTVSLGQQYKFTLALSASSQATADGEGVRIRIYYLDAASQKVYLADRQVLSNESRALNPGAITQLIDYSVTTAVIAAGNAAIGKAIGVELVGDSTAQGGYWDFDNARLDTVPEPSATALLLLAAGSCLGLRRRK